MSRDSVMPMKAGEMIEFPGIRRLMSPSRLSSIGVGVVLGLWPGASVGSVPFPPPLTTMQFAHSAAVRHGVDQWETDFATGNAKSWNFAAMPRPSAMSPVVNCVTVYPLPQDVHLAIRKSGTRSLKWWIAWISESLNAIDPESGRTPLMTALIAEKPKHVRILLEAGAQPNLTDGVGNSALHVAAQINEPWHVLAMLKAGANPRLRNAQGQTFQRYLFMTPDKLLNSKTRDGMTAVINWLVANGIEVEGRSTAAARETAASGTTK